MLLYFGGNNILFKCSHTALMKAKIRIFITQLRLQNNKNIRRNAPIMRQTSNIFTHAHELCLKLTISFEREMWIFERVYFRHNKSFSLYIELSCPIILNIRLTDVQPVSFYNINITSQMMFSVNDGKEKRQNTATPTTIQITHDIRRWASSHITSKCWWCSRIAHKHCFSWWYHLYKGQRKIELSTSWRTLIILVLQYPVWRNIEHCNKLSQY